MNDNENNVFNICTDMSLERSIELFTGVAPDVG